MLIEVDEDSEPETDGDALGETLGLSLDCSEGLGLTDGLTLPLALLDGELLTERLALALELVLAD